MIHITNHAIERWQERVENIPGEAVRYRIEQHLPAIVAAARFGAPSVKLGNGVRLILDGRSVVTVLGRGMRVPMNLR